MEHVGQGWVDLSRFQNEGLDVRKKVDPTSFSQHYLTVADVQ